MSRKGRLAFRWTAFSALFLAGGIAAAALLAPHPGSESEGPLRGLTDVLAREAPADAPALAFTDVAASAGLIRPGFAGVRTRSLPEDMGAGVAAVDLDGDDDLDLVLVGTGPLGRGGRTLLFENRGDWRFVDRTDGSGVDFVSTGMGVAAGDYDGDGDLDLYLTAFGRTALYRNDGGWRFADVTAAAGVGAVGFPAGAVFADLDRDGDLDLYVCRYVDYAPDPADAAKAAASGSERGGYSLPFTLNPSSFDPEPNLLFENLGDGTFRVVAAPAGAANAKGRSLGAVAADIDGDGRPDLYVANDVSDNVFLRGLGGLRFEDASYETATADYRGAMGLAAGDLTGDGVPDLYVTHWLAQENALYENLTVRVGRPFFTDRATPLGLGAPALDVVGWGTALADLDRDGRPDLVVANGSTFEVPEDPARLVPEPMQLFWNGGGKRGFFDLAPRAGPALAADHVARGLAAGDLDRDGDPDLVVFRHDAPPLLLRNDLQNGHGFLRVRVRGAGKNRFGVGTLVCVTAGGRTTAGILGATPSYLSAAEPEILFGLGDAAEADVTVTFADGTVRRYPARAAGSTLIAERP